MRIRGDRPPCAGLPHAGEWNWTPERTQPLARGATSEIASNLPIVLVSIHAPARGATTTELASAWSSMFQSTPPRGGRRRAGGDQPAASLVSIHAPARGATPHGRNRMDGGRVSIHAPARGATGCCLKWRLTLAVSIHAPARGATKIWTNWPRARPVSIHAPARGATPYCMAVSNSMLGFNPRPRAGGDIEC